MHLFNCSPCLITLKEAGGIVGAEMAFGRTVTSVGAVWHVHVWISVAECMMPLGHQSSPPHFGQEMEAASALGDPGIFLRDALGVGARDEQ
jgi:hypothetical protein